MLKASIVVNEFVDPTDTLEGFRSKCEQSGIANPEVLFRQVEQEVADLSERGSKLVAVGSKFNITRTLSGDDYKVTIRASYGDGKPSLIHRFITSLKG